MCPNVLIKEFAMVPVFGISDAGLWNVFCKATTSQNARTKVDLIELWQLRPCHVVRRSMDRRVCIAAVGLPNLLGLEMSGGCLLSTQDIFKGLPQFDEKVWLSVMGFFVADECRFLWLASFRSLSTFFLHFLHWNPKVPSEAMQRSHRDLT